MECEVCKERSSVGYCTETNVLICEICSVPCEKCGALMNSKAAHFSERSGRAYCSACWAERKESKDKKKKTEPPKETAADTSFAALATEQDEMSDRDIAAKFQVDEELEEEAALKASAWKPPPPWKLSFQSAILGLVAITIVFIFPSFYRVTLPGGQVILTPYILIMVPVLAILWGGVGLTSNDYMADKTRSLLGVLIGILAMIMCIAAVTRDPLNRVQDAQVESRDGYNRAQLRAWREKVLERHWP